MPNKKNKRSTGLTTTPGRKVVHVPIQAANTSTCYFCSKPIAADQRIRRFHELTVHEVCWQREAR
jgi:hypothetical protein